MEMSVELLSIAEMDLQASRVLYENGLYPQAVFYFQQSVEKANKVFALITNQVKEKELLKEVGHETINIYRKSLRHQKERYERLKDNFNKLPELKTIKIFKKLNIEKNLRQLDRFLSQIKKIKDGKKELIYISAWEIRRFLKEIESTKKDTEKEKQNITKFKITERAWNKEKKEILEQLNIFAKYDPMQFEEAKNKLERADMRLLAEKLIKNLIEPMSIIIPLSVSLYYLAIVTLPHASITRYPRNDLTPINIYTKNLPIVRKLPELFQVHTNVLNELKILNQMAENINAGFN